MNMIEAFLNGDNADMFDDSPDIIFSDGEINYPKDNFEKSADIFSFTHSELFELFEEKQKNGANLESFRNEIVDKIDTEINNYSFPLFIFDNYRRRYFINNRGRKFYFSSDEYYVDEEERAHVEKSIKDRDDIIVIWWNVTGN